MSYKILESFIFKLFIDKKVPLRLEMIIAQHTFPVQFVVHPIQVPCANNKAISDECMSVYKIFNTTNKKRFHYLE